MQLTIKQFIFLTIFSLIVHQSVKADLASDSKLIFNLAEQSYPQWFSPPLNSNQFPPDWPYYRGPYNKDVYVGVHKEGSIYVLGSDFGINPVRIGTTQEVIALLHGNSDTQAVPFGPGTGNIAANKNLSTAQATIAEIKGIAGLNEVVSTWFAGEWATYYFDNGSLVEKKLSFNLDGTYHSESINENKETSEITRDHGKWLLVATTPESSKLNLTLWNSAGNLATNYPIESEGENGFRLINQSSKPDVRSILYSRINSTADSRFPGMFLLGSFEYTNYNGKPDQYLFQYQFNNDGSVRRLIFGNFSLDKTLQSDTMGTWSIDPTGSQLQLTFAGNSDNFNIRNASPSSVSMYTSETEYQYWKRLQEPILTDFDPFVGEFQGNDRESYLSIKKDGDNYLVDVAEPHDTGDRYYQAPGTLLQNGQLSITVPAQYNQETNLILQAGYNKLIIKESPGVFFLPLNDNHYVEKVSSSPLLINPVNILGQWRHTLYVGKGGYFIFLDDGRYYASEVTFEYGTYALEGNSVSMTPACGDSYQRNFEIVDHRLKLNSVFYTPVPGIREYGNIGTQLENTLFKSQLDRLQELNGAKLKPHPLYAGVFVFAEETKFSATYLAMTFKPDGTGNQFTGSILEVYDAWDLRNYIGLQIDSFLFGIEYYVTIDGDKETVVFYNKGTWVSDYQDVLNFGSFNADPGSARELKLYHGRTAICYILNDNDGDTVLPIVN